MKSAFQSACPLLFALVFIAPVVRGADAKNHRETTASGVVKVHVYPYELKPGDTLADGNGKKFPIKEPTILIWADLQPGARFVHPSWYVLVSTSTPRAEQGEWWPVINGNRFYPYDDRNAIAVMPPLVLERPERPEPLLTKSEKPRVVKIYPYPYVVRSGDQIADGPNPGARGFPIKEDTAFVWVDLLPNAYFAHPTSYILISASGVQVEKGEWWPLLNGTELFRHQNQAALVSPLILSKP